MTGMDINDFQVGLQRCFKMFGGLRSLSILVHLGSQPNSHPRFSDYVYSQCFALVGSSGQGASLDMRLQLKTIIQFLAQGRFIVLPCFDWKGLALLFWHRFERVPQD